MKVQIMILVLSKNFALETTLSSNVQINLYLTKSGDSEFYDDPDIVRNTLEFEGYEVES